MKWLRDYPKKCSIENKQNGQKQPPYVPYEKVYLYISQNSQENTCARAAWGLELY